MIAHDEQPSGEADSTDLYDASEPPIESENRDEADSIGEQNYRSDSCPNTRAKPVSATILLIAMAITFKLPFNQEAVCEGIGAE
jgi:hypothetical protein